MAEPELPPMPDVLELTFFGKPVSVRRTWGDHWTAGPVGAKRFRDGRWWVEFHLCGVAAHGAADSLQEANRQLDDTLRHLRQWLTGEL